MIAHSKHVPDPPTAIRAKDSGKKGKGKNDQILTLDKLERDHFGRIIDPRDWAKNLRYEDLGKEITWPQAAVFMYGPGFKGTVFVETLMNIYTGNTFESGHHSGNGKAKERCHWLKGRRNYAHAPM